MHFHFKRQNCANIGRPQFTDIIQKSFVERTKLIFVWKRATSLCREVRPIFGTLHGYQSSQRLVGISQVHHQQEQNSNKIFNKSVISSFQWLICTDCATFWSEMLNHPKKGLLVIDTHVTFML